MRKYLNLSSFRYSNYFGPKRLLFIFTRGGILESIESITKVNCPNSATPAVELSALSPTLFIASIPPNPLNFTSQIHHRKRCIQSFPIYPLAVVRASSTTQWWWGQRRRRLRRWRFQCIVWRKSWITVLKTSDF